MEKRFDDKKSIKLFIKAIEEGKKIEGSLDYTADFLMTVVMENNQFVEYHLNISNIETDQRGLYLKLHDTVQGYRISEKTSRKLKELIYHS